MGLYRSLWLGYNITTVQLALYGGFILPDILPADHNEQREERQKDHDHFIIRHMTAPFRICTRLRRGAHRQHYLPTPTA